MQITGCRTNKLNLAVSWGLLLLTAAGIGFFLIVSPKNTDDYWFAISFKDWLGKYGIRDIDCGWKLLETGWPIREIINTWVYHITMDCGRVSNLVMMFFLFLPKWVGSSVALGFWYICMNYSLRLARVNLSRSPWLVALALFCWSFLIGWQDRMGALAYQFNYLVPSGLTIWFVWLVESKVNSSLRKHKHRLLILLFLIGIFVGLWHEGFTLPVITGGIGVVMLFPRYRQAGCYAAIAGLSTALAMLFLCPAFALRASVQVELFSAPVLVVLDLFSSHVLIFVTALWILGRWIRKGMHSISPIFMFSLVSSAVSFGLLVFSGGYRRIAWWGDLISVVALLELIRTSGINRTGAYRVLKWGIIVVAGGLSMVHWVLVDYFVWRNREAVAYVIDILKQGKTRQVFADFTPITKLPFICLKTPDDDFFLDDWSLRLLNGFYPCDRVDAGVRIIPYGLKWVTDESGEEVPGSSGLRVIDGILFVNPGSLGIVNTDRAYGIWGDVKMSSGIGGKCKLVCYPFTSQKDGKTYFYVKPDEHNILMLTGTPREFANLQLEN